MRQYHHDHVLFIYIIVPKPPQSSQHISSWYEKEWIYTEAQTASVNQNINIDLSRLFLFNLKIGSKNLPCTSWFNKLLSNNYSSVSATNRTHSYSRLFLASVNMHRFLVLQLKRCTSNKMLSQYTKLIVVLIHLILVKSLDQLN